MVLYSLTEFQLGHAKTIQVAARDRRFSVEDDGRGHAIERTVEGAPYLKFIYNHLDYPFGSTEAKPIQLQGLGMPLLNSLCRELEVSVVKKTASLHMRFERGRLVAHQFTEIASEKTGNRISGEVAAELGEPPAAEEALKSWLQAVAGLGPVPKVSFNGQELAALQVSA